MENEKTEGSEECCCECDEEEDLLTDEDGLSDSDEESDKFEPVPYCFVLKDVFGNPVVLPPEQMANALTDCPPFYKLLDHVTAVLWMFYNKQNLGGLTTSDLHWAINFLEGLKDNQNKYSPDVEMAQNHLKDALLQMYVNIDADELESRLGKKPGKGDGYFESTRIQRSEVEGEEAPEGGEDSPGYQGFQGGENGPSYIGSDSSRVGSEARRELLFDQPSVILVDMLGRRDQDTLKEILNISKARDDVVAEAAAELAPCAVTVEDAKDAEQSLEDITKWKTQKMDEIMNILEKLKQIDNETMNMKCGTDAQTRARIDNLLK